MNAATPPKPCPHCGADMLRVRIPEHGDFWGHPTEPRDCWNAGILAIVPARMEMWNRRAPVRGEMAPGGAMRAQIVGDRFVISASIAELVAGSTTGPYFDLIYGQTDKEPVVTDAAQWAAEVVREINAESENGTTAIHRMVDEAAERAFENGAEGLSVAPAAASEEG